jgi:hypothetical protein
VWNELQVVDRVQFCLVQTVRQDIGEFGLFLKIVTEIGNRVPRDPRGNARGARFARMSWVQVGLAL